MITEYYFSRKILEDYWELFYNVSIITETQKQITNQVPGIRLICMILVKLANIQYFISLSENINVAYKFPS